VLLLYALTGRTGISKTIILDVYFHKDLYTALNDDYSTFNFGLSLYSNRRYGFKISGTVLTSNLPHFIKTDKFVETLTGKTPTHAVLTSSLYKMRK